MNYIKIQITTEIERQNELILLLDGFGVEQYEEMSHEVVAELGRDEFSWDYVDPEILDISEEMYQVTFYLTEHEKELAKKIQEEIEGKDFGTISMEEIEEEDWANNWKEYFHPIPIDETLTIVPTWEEYHPREGEKVITIDPGMAFGSGTHETTFMCMEALAKYVHSGNTVFDIGCGSGILSLVAAKKGAKKVLGIDLDPVCVSASNQNVALNQMEDQITILEGDLFQVVKGQADIIVSNLFAEVIVGMLEDLQKHIVSEGIFISSGILAEKADLVKNALVDLGYEILEDHVKGEWACVVAKAGKK